MIKDNIRNCNGELLPRYLIGKSIRKVEKTIVSDGYRLVDGYRLFCRDKTIIEIGINEGCGGCGNGWSEIDLMKLNENQNVITNVEFKQYASDEKYKWDSDSFTLFIYYEDKQITEICGSDGYGNGYYGGGFYVNVISIKKEGENNE